MAKELKKCNVTVGRFQPFTEGHMKMVEAGYKENNLPCVILQIPNTKNDAKHPFTDELIREEIKFIMNEQKNANHTSIAGHFYVKNADIAKIAKTCHENGFEPVLWLCGSDRYPQYSKQADTEKYKVANDMLMDFKAFEVKRTDDDTSATKVRQAIKDDDFTTYMRMMPQGFDENTPLWEKFKKELSQIKEGMKSISKYISESLNNSFTMKSITQYIIEKVKEETKFDKVLKNYDEIIKAKPNLKNIDGFKELIDDIVSIKGLSDRPFTCCDKYNYIKLRRSYEDDVKILIKKHPDFEMNRLSSGTWIKSKSKKRNVILFGNGSEGRVSTTSQEVGTCLVWNMYVSEGKGKYDEEVLNIDYLKELLSPLSNNFETDWYNSFIKQVNMIRKFLERFRIGGKNHINPLDYKLERYGYSDESYDFKVANAYKKFIETYCKSLNANKDNLEPSDVICFNVKNSTKQEFIDKFNELENIAKTDPLSAKEKYINDLFLTGKFFGISLKKITSKNPTYELYNIGGNKERIPESVESYTIKSNTENGIGIICKGKFKFIDNVIDEKTGKEINEDESRYCKVTLRTFGNNQTGIDVQLCHNEEGSGLAPSMGKAAIEEVRTILKKYTNNSLKNIKEYKEAFNEMLNDKDSLKYLATIIRSAVKNGPNCFPFVIVH